MDLSKCGGTCKGDCQHYAIGVDCGDKTYQPSAASAGCGAALGGEKKARMFYWEEGCDAFVPCPPNVENILTLEDLDDGEVREIQFKRFDMTDEEYDALPEG